MPTVQGEELVVNRVYTLDALFPSGLKHLKNYVYLEEVNGRLRFQGIQDSDILDFAENEIKRIRWNGN